MLLHLLAKNWWIVLLRGIAAMLFGIIALAWPGITLVALMLVGAVYALADGLFALFAAVAGGTMAPRWWLALAGVLGIVAGALTFLYPGLTALVMLTFLAAWCVVRGLFEIIGAIQLRKEIENEWMLILNGLVSLLAGILLLAWPGAGLVAAVWCLGVYGLACGLLLTGLALRLRKHQRALPA